MGWEERLKEWGKVIKGQDDERIVAERVARQEIKRRRKEEERLFIEITPQVKEVGRRIAHAVNGKFGSTKGDFPDDELSYSIKTHSGGEVKLKSKKGGGDDIINEGKIIITTDRYTGAFLEKCRESNRGMTREIEGYSLGKVHFGDYDTSIGRYVAAYCLPFNHFNPEKLAAVIEEFLKETTDPKADIHV